MITDKLIRNEFATNRIRAIPFATVSKDKAEREELKIAFRGFLLLIEHLGEIMERNGDESTVGK